MKIHTMKNKWLLNEYQYKTRFEDSLLWTLQIPIEDIDVRGRTISQMVEW
jgi:hypothetical protein